MPARRAIARRRARTLGLRMQPLVAAMSCAALADPPAVPAHLPPNAPRVEVIDTHHASERAAQGVVPTFVAPVERCVHAAHERDPVGLAAQEAAIAVVRVGVDGGAEAVEITPSNLAQGLSACLAVELLAWRQPGTLGSRPSVTLLLNLAP